MPASRLGSARQSAFGGIGKDQPAVERIGRKRVRRRFAVGLFEHSTERQRDLPDRIVLCKLLGRRDRPGRANDAFRRLARKAQEVGADHPMIAVQRSLVPALGERKSRQRAGSPGAAKHDRVRMRRDRVQHLGSYRRIRSCVSLIGDDLDVGRFRVLDQRIVHEVAEGIGISNECHGLQPAPLHVIDDFLHQKRRWLRRLHHPWSVLAGWNRRDRGNRDHRHLHLDRRGRHCQGLRRP